MLYGKPGSAEEAVALARSLAESSETPAVMQAEVAKLLSLAEDHNTAIRLGIPGDEGDDT